MPWWKNLLIITYLLVQVALPLRGCWYEKFESRGNFTWNMYSRIYQCWSQYRLDTPDGSTQWPDSDHHFNRQESSRVVFYLEYLPRYNRWLCDKYRLEGKLGSLRGYVNCSVNLGPLWELLDPDVDLCTAPNYGVRAQLKAKPK